MEIPNVSPWHLLTARAYMASMKPIDLEKHPPQAEAVALFPAEVAWRFCVVPVVRLEGRLVLALADVATVEHLREIETACGHPIRPVLAASAQVRAALERHFPVSP